MDATHAKPLASGAWVARQLQLARCLEKEIMKNKAIFGAGPTVSLLVVALFLGCGGSTAGSSSGNLECDAAAVQDYFGGTCASGLADMFTCWGASGQCNATVDASGYDVVFDSGAVLEHTFGTGGQNLSARYLSPSKEVCGAFTTSGDFVGNDWQINYNTRSGEEYQLRPTGSPNEFEIVCSSGATVPVNGVEQERLQECAGGDAVSICTRPDNIGTDGDIDDILDAIGRPCTNNSECPSGGGVALVCCDFFGEQICYENTVCQAFQ